MGEGVVRGEYYASARPYLLRIDLRDITPLKIKQSEMATKTKVDERMVEPEKAHKLETFGELLYMARDLAAGASVCLG